MADLYCRETDTAYDEVCEECYRAPLAVVHTKDQERLQASVDRLDRLLVRLVRVDLAVAISVSTFAAIAAIAAVIEACR